ncbi:MAG: M91 family zinc metallopeptidase [bacterium]|nr:M91 family zinc metallopeptidase [bacterium]
MADAISGKSKIDGMSAALAATQQGTAAARAMMGSQAFANVSGAPAVSAPAFNSMDSSSISVFNANPVNSAGSTDSIMARFLQNPMDNPLTRSLGMFGTSGTANTVGTAAPAQQVGGFTPSVFTSPAQSQAQSADDSVALSNTASQLVDSGVTAKVLSSDSPYQVGGAGVQTDGDMSLADMKAALADARGVSVNDILVLGGSNQNDNINVTAGTNGGLSVDVNGQKYELTADQAQRLIIYGGAGNDQITVDAAVINDLVIMGGAGDDTIQGGSGNDTIVGGQGNDVLKGGKGMDRITDDAGFNKIYGEDGDDVLIAHSDAVDSSGKNAYANVIYGGAGRDYIEGGNASDYLSGGAGYDVIYGLGGNDVLSGGAGKDYLDGGEGDDTLFGGSGNDNLVGGVGNDKLYGGADNDVVVGGKGTDTVYGGDGSDSIITSGNDTLADKADGDTVTTVKDMNIPSNFYVTGDKYETARIKSDLEFLSSVLNGQKLFSEIAKTGHSVTIDTVTGGNSCGTYAGLNSDPTQGSDSFVHYNLSKIYINSGSSSWGLRAPVIGMFHELCHSYNAAIGNMDQNYYDQATGKKVADGAAGSAKGLEWQAVGLQNANIDNNPDLLTENGLRSLLGFEQRTRY